MGADSRLRTDHRLVLTSSRCPVRQAISSHVKSPETREAQAMLQMASCGQSWTDFRDYKMIVTATVVLHDRQTLCSAYQSCDVEMPSALMIVRSKILVDGQNAASDSLRQPLS
jgi:hypothetical protein